MNLLDFAGQNVFYNSHQFFLTRKSIYFLVFNANSLDFTSNISYWLKTLSNQIQGRPLPNVFLIGTHIDEIPEENREVSMEKIKKELSNFCKSLKHTINIKGISLICSTKRQDVDYLKEHYWAKNTFATNPHLFWKNEKTSRREKKNVFFSCAPIWHLLAEILQLWRRNHKDTLPRRYHQEGDQLSQRNGHNYLHWHPSTKGLDNIRSKMARKQDGRYYFF